MKNLFLASFLLSCFTVFAQRHDISFQAAIKSNFKKSNLKQITVLSLKNGSSPHTVDTLKNDTLKYVGDFPISSINIIEKKEANDLLKMLSDSVNFIQGTVTKSCAFVPSHVFVFSNNNLQLLAFSNSCNQLAIISSDLKKTFAVGNLSIAGSERVIEVLKTLNHIN